MYERGTKWCCRSTRLFSKSFLGDYRQISQLVVFSIFALCEIWTECTVCSNMPSKFSCLHFHMVWLHRHITQIRCRNCPFPNYNSQKYPLSSELSPPSHHQQTSWVLYLTEYSYMCVSPRYHKSNYKHRNGGGSPVIHRLEDNRQTMNDEDEWHSILPNVALNKWIPRALLIISMSFPPAMFQHKSC